MLWGGGGECCIRGGSGCKGDAERRYWWNIVGTRGGSTVGGEIGLGGRHANAAHTVTQIAQSGGQLSEDGESQWRDRA